MDGIPMLVLHFGHTSSLHVCICGAITDFGHYTYIIPSSVVKYKYQFGLFVKFVSFIVTNEVQSIQMLIILIAFLRAPTLKVPMSN